MKIDTEAFNSAKGEIIVFDDIPESAVEKYILNEEESQLKKIIWKSQNQEYLDDLKKR